MTTSTSANKPSLAILDDYFDIAPKHFAPLHPTHLSTISSYPSTINALSDPEASVSRLHPYTIISTMRERTAFPRSILGHLPNLRLLLTTGTRNNSIDTTACEDLGITLAGATGKHVKIRADGYDNTSEHCWALILTLAKGTARDDLNTKAHPAGPWQLRPSINLAGKTLAVLGLGKLGSNVARTAVLGFGMKVISWSSSLTQAKADEQAVAKGLPQGTFEAVASKDELFARADVLSVQYVLSERSRGIVGARELGLMKPSALLVNTSRGPLIDEQALLQCLNEGRIRGAALDVFAEEPLPADSQWRSTGWGKEGRSELVLSPHMGYVEEQTLEAWYQEQAENVERWCKGEEVENLMTKKK